MMSDVYQPFNHNLTIAYCEDVTSDNKIPLSTSGIVIPAITASISAISSTLIIVIIIFRTSKKLKSTYHRLMVGISLSDIMSSTAIAFNFLPWPKDALNYFDNNMACHLIRLPIYGNTASCAAQGFFILFGSTAAMWFNLSICLYYSFNLGKMMRDEEMRRNGIELALLVVPFIVASVLSFVALFLKMFNPSSGSPWCTFNRYPQRCYNMNDNVWQPVSDDSCAIRGNQWIEDKFNIVGLSLLVIILFLIALSYIFIGVKVWRRGQTNIEDLKTNIENARRRQADEYEENPPTDTHQDDQDNEANSHQARLEQLILKNKQMFKITLIQSVLYTFSMILIYLFQIIGALILLINPTFKDALGQYVLVQRGLVLVFQPLQGFMNLCIFVWSKVASRRLFKPDLSVRSILCDLFPGCSRFNDNEGSNDISNTSSLVHLEESFDPDAWGSLEEIPSNNDPLEPNSGNVLFNLSSKLGWNVSSVLGWGSSLEEIPSNNDPLEPNSAGNNVHFNLSSDLSIGQSNSRPNISSTATSNDNVGDNGGNMIDSSFVFLRRGGTFLPNSAGNNVHLNLSSDLSIGQSNSRPNISSTATSNDNVGDN